MWKQSSGTSSKRKITGAQQVYDCALDLLSCRDYSERELQQRLLRKGADAVQAAAAIARLQDCGLQDDSRYALRVYEAWLEKRCYGRLHLQAELQKRGIKREQAERVLALFTPELEERQAENAAELFLQRNRRKIIAAAGSDQKIYAAAGRFMMARGFSSGYIRILWEKLQADTNI